MGGLAVGIKIRPGLPLFYKRKFLRIVGIETKVVLNASFLEPCGSNEGLDDGTKFGRTARLGREMSYDKYVI